MILYPRRAVPAVLILVLAIFASSPAVAARYASMVVEAKSGEVLYARNADKRRHPASLTKIMTLYLLFDALERGKVTLDTRLKVSKRAQGQRPSRLGLKAGQTIRVKDAILALVTKSANDVATVVAENLAGNEVMFARAMTAKARKLGMKRTTFTNASGLHNRYQVTTARDMVMLAAALLEDFPQYYHYFGTRKFKFGRRRHGNHNNLLGRYAGADGIKTGYIDAAGFNLVASAKRGPHRLIGVVFGGRTSRTRDRHMVNLLDRGFAEIKKRRPLTAALPPMPVRKPTLAAKRGDPIATAAAGSSATEVSETPSERGSAPLALGPRGWGVQVGAYQQLASARLRARQVAGVLPAMLTRTSVQIQAANEYNKAVYRTRFVGFEQGEAHRACKLLERRSIGCLVVRPNGRIQ